MPVWLQRVSLMAVAASLLVACVPITVDGVQALPGGTVPIATETPTVTPSPTPDDSATATVITRALRVRQEPTVNSPLVGDIVNGESFPVIGRSSDGMWLELELPQFDFGRGWVSVDLVTMRGDITDLPIVKIPTPPPPTATFTPAPVPTVALPTPTLEAGAAITETVEVPAEATVEPGAPVTETVTLTDTTVDEPTPTPAPTAEGIAVPADGSATVTADWRVRIRAEPNTEAPIVGFGYRGETFPVLEVSADGQWVRLGGSPATPENTEGGWVSAQFLVIGQ